MAKIKVEINYSVKNKNLPSLLQFKQWVNAALKNAHVEGIVSIKIVDETESQSLNHTYRKKNYPTNVLAFPYLADGLIGDLAICAVVVEREAAQQAKVLEAHWAHMVIPGCLHCVGYDHMLEDERLEMEALEIFILKQLNYNNPYEEEIVT